MKRKRIRERKDKIKQRRKIFFCIFNQDKKFTR